MFARFQKSIFLLFIGYLLLPFLFSLPFFFASPIEYNYTGLFNHPSYRLLAMLSFFFALVGIFYFLYIAGKEKENWFWKCLFVFVFTILSALIPYPNQENIWSALHLLSSYLSFFFVHILLFQLFFLTPTFRNLYLFFLLFLFFLTLTIQYINGVVELIYAIGLCFFLTTFIKKSTGSTD